MRNPRALTGNVLRAALVGLMFATVAQAFAQEQKLETAKSQEIPYIEIRGAINVATVEYFNRGLAEAKKSQAPAFIIKLDTPGGFLDSTRDLVQIMLAEKDLKLVVWVNPEGARAASAGSMITMAAHYAAMAPATSIGAATPVDLEGKGEIVKKDSKDAMGSKVTNDTLSFVEGIARERGRNVEWARKSVSEAASLSSEMALKEKVIDGVHRSSDELVKAVQEKFGFPGPYSLRLIPSNLRENVLGFVSNPNVVYGLFALGTLGIYVEMTNPGLIIPGTIGALSLALAAISTKIVPIQPGAIGLLVLGLILLGIEVLTPLPTYGVAGVLGVLSLFFSGAFLMDPSQTNLTLSAELWLPLFFIIVFAMGYLGWAAMSALRTKPFRQGINALEGEEAEIVSLSGDTKARVKLHGGEIWNAEWEPNTVPRDSFAVGAKVVVTRQSGFKVFIKELTKKS